MRGFGFCNLGRVNTRCHGLIHRVSQSNEDDREDEQQIEHHRRLLTSGIVLTGRLIEGEIFLGIGPCFFRRAIDAVRVRRLVPFVDNRTTPTPDTTNV